MQDRSIIRLALLLAIATIAPAAQLAADAPRPKHTIVDCDGVPPLVSQANGLQLTEVAGKNANHFLRITATKGGQLKGGVVFRLPDGVTPDKTAGLAARLRAGGGRPATLRWLAADDKNHVLLQRRIDLPPSDQLQEVAMPWTRWRWGDATAGGPAEIRKVGIRIEEGPAELDLDDLRFVEAVGKGDGGGAEANESARDWLRHVAFGARDARTAEADGMLVASDAVEELGDAELGRILNRMRCGRAMVRRWFGDAVRPVQGSTPPSLLIFRRHGDFVRFFEAMGTEWNVRIVPSSTPGMTIQNIAACVYDPKQGAGRPVFLHESLHVVLATDLRLLTTSEQHSWLQEGVASYVQGALYPQSIDRKEFAEQFRKPIDAGGTGMFKPLDKLLEARARPRDYAQLAALVAYLVEEKPQWLPTIAIELTSGRATEQAFRKCGTSLPELQSAWMKWGAAKVAGGNDAGVLLPVPEEFRAVATD